MQQSVWYKGYRIIVEGEGDGNKCSIYVYNAEGDLEFESVVQMRFNRAIDWAKKKLDHGDY